MPDPISFSSVTPRFGLPLLFVGQTQKEATVNEAQLLSDFLLHASIESVVNAPPATPAAGAVWLVGTAPTGAFSGKANQLAGWSEAGWRFIAPVDGLRVLDRGAGVIRLYHGGWRAAAPIGNVAGGTVVDTEARAAIAALTTALKTARIIPTA